MDAVDAARVMAERGVSRLPVVDQTGDMVGIVTYANLSQVMEQLTRDLLGGWQKPVT